MRLDDAYQRIYEKTMTETFAIDGGYLVSFKPLPGKHSFLAVNTMFVGHEGKHEVRSPGRVGTLVVKAHFNLLDYPLISVVNLAQLHSFLTIGGHAIVSDEVITTHWADILNPRIVVSNPDIGFVDYSSIEEKYKK